MKAITSKMLRNRGLCRTGLAAFRKKYPKGIRPSVQNCKKLVDESILADAGFLFFGEICIAVDSLLSGKQLMIFDSMVHSLRDRWPGSRKRIMFARVMARCLQAELRKKKKGKKK